MADNTRQFDQPALVPVPPALKSAEGRLSEQALIALKDFVLALGNKINGLISFGSGTVDGWIGNIDGQKLVFTTDTAPGTEFAVYHGLGRVPIGRIILHQKAAGSLYGSSKESWTEKKVYFKSDVASVEFTVALV